MRILLIDDDPGYTRLVRMLLSGVDGCTAELECEETLASGLERLRDEQFDALLLELTLPDSRGLETLHRARPLESKVPVVVLTELDDEEMARKALESGAQDYLVKCQITGELLVRSIRYGIERRKLEEALKDSAENFRDLFDEAPNAFFCLGVDGLVREANRRACQLLQRSNEDLIGRSIIDIYADTPEGKEKANLFLERFKAGEPMNNEELQIQRADGGIIWVNLSVSPVEDTEGNIVKSRYVMVDITERKLAEEELRFRAELLDAATDAIFVHDLDGNFTYVNQAACSQRGYTWEELMAMNLHDIDVPEYKKLIAPRFQELVETGTAVFETAHFRKNGSLFPVEINARMLETGEGGLVLSIARDITERKRTEETLRKNEQQLKDLITVAAHELRHPLSLFKGYSEILLNYRDELDTADVQLALIGISKATKRTTRLMNQLLNASRVEQGSLRLNYEDINCRSLAFKVMEESRAMGCDNVAFLNEREEDIHVTADSASLRIVLLALIENAVKFSPDGSRVSIWYEKSGPEVAFHVADLGPGIPVEYRESIFDRFFQVEEAEHHSLPGIGLGLHIAKAVIEAHGGRIWVEPRDVAGSIFSFSIPREGLNITTRSSEEVAV